MPKYLFSGVEELQLPEKFSRKNVGRFLSKSQVLPNRKYWGIQLEIAEKR